MEQLEKECFFSIGFVTLVGLSLALLKTLMEWLPESKANTKERRDRCQMTSSECLDPAIPED